MNGELPTGEKFEKSILSTILQEPDKLYDAVEAGVSENLFYNSANKVMWNVINDRVNAGQPLELVTLTSDLMQSPLYSKLGEVSRITEVYTYAPTSSYFDLHVDELKKVHALRMAYQLAEKVSISVLNGSTCDEVVELLGQPVTEVHEMLQGNLSAFTAKDAIRSFTERFKKRMAGESVPAFECGVASLDRLYGGIPKPSYTVITAFPSTGKTTLGIQIAHGVCARGGKAKFFSLEMTGDEVADRLMITASGVDGSVISRPDKNKPTKGQLNTLKHAMHNVSDYKLEINDKPRVHIDEICAAARKSHREEELDVIVLDYAQKIRGTRKNGDSHERECADVSGKLQGLKKELGCSIILLSQLTEKNGSIATKGGEVYTEDADYWFQIIREKGAEDVEDIVTMKDRHSGTNGKMHYMDFDKNKQVFVSKPFVST